MADRLEWINGIIYCESCGAYVNSDDECLCIVEREAVMAEAEEKRVWPMVILGGSETFEKELASLEDFGLAEENAWMEETGEDIPVSAEEVIERIRNYRSNRAEVTGSGGGGCGGGGCGSCSCGNR